MNNITNLSKMLQSQLTIFQISIAAEFNIITCTIQSHLVRIGTNKKNCATGLDKYVFRQITILVLSRLQRSTKKENLTFSNAYNKVGHVYLPTSTLSEYDSTQLHFLFK